MTQVGDGAVGASKLMMSAHGVRMSEERAATENTRLSVAGRYGRDVQASVARVWENVFDWAHLPDLHAESFAAIELMEDRPDGWRVRLLNRPVDRSAPQVLELAADRAAGRYVVTTLEGPGAGSQVHTRLAPLGPHRTSVEVEFHVPEVRPERLSAIGARYAAIYARLWDEDEAMMRAREAALTLRSCHPTVAAPVELGPVEALRARLPLVVDLGSDRYRLVELDGDVVVHGTVCPHWLAPLDEAPVVDGVVRCPWHGYRFDARTGCSVDGRGLRLAPPPKLVVQGGLASLVPTA